MEVIIKCEIYINYNKNGNNKNYYLKIVAF